MLTTDALASDFQLGGRTGLTAPLVGDMFQTLSPSHIGLRPDYDLATTEFFSESLANRRTNARQVAEVVDGR